MTQKHVDTTTLKKKDDKLTKYIEKHPKSKLAHAYRLGRQKALLSIIKHLEDYIRILCHSDR